METFSPNSVASYTVSVYGQGGTIISAILSGATLTVSGRTLNATIDEQTLSVTLPSDLATGTATFLWAWTQIAGGVTSQQTFSETVTITAQSTLSVASIESYSNYVTAITGATHNTGSSENFVFAKQSDNNDKYFNYGNPVRLRNSVDTIIIYIGNIYLDTTNATSVVFNLRNIKDSSLVTEFSNLPANIITQFPSLVSYTFSSKPTRGDYYLELVTTIGEVTSKSPYVQIEF